MEKGASSEYKTIARAMVDYRLCSDDLHAHERRPGALMASLKPFQVGFIARVCFRSSQGLSGQS
ncbi:hypothetical protein EV13_0134 [Prochlorococcus sp. MIT 0702]|nr:hypothetical protein EV12_0352 [Prochlorococcus sp. MIT 0701]KGG30629.1 hypothetical protein EV13_0134 [Prochlorococcus sp. MIT 0702]KGG36649.1 hypothetical protein EV14_0205 [Prochlorococcus sp. MIT 0703]